MGRRSAPPPAPDPAAGCVPTRVSGESVTANALALAARKSDRQAPVLKKLLLRDAFVCYPSNFIIIHERFLFLNLRATMLVTGRTTVPHVWDTLTSLRV